MSKLILTSLFFGFIFSTCADEPKEKFESQIKYLNFYFGNAKEAFYTFEMKKLNFQYEINGPCDDALEDTLYERNTAVIESIKKTKDQAVVEYKFKEACCQGFMGTYSILNDTLIYEYEVVGDEVCSCMCWDRYKLTINEPESNYKVITIRSR